VFEQTEIEQHKKSFHRGTDTFLNVYLTVVFNGCTRMPMSNLVFPFRETNKCNSNQRYMLTCETLINHDLT